MTRRVVGVVVVALWVMGLAFLFKRNGNHSPQQALAEAGLRVSPDVFYYTVQHKGIQVGAASSSVDTLKQRIVAVDFLRGVIPVGNDSITLEARSEARFTRGMRLRDFVVKAIGDLLGHRSLEATCVYLRIDVDMLRTVALPVPVIVSMQGADHE